MIFVVLCAQRRGNETNVQLVSPAQEAFVISFLYPQGVSPVVQIANTAGGCFSAGLSQGVR
jgi:hypothetical protein